MPDDDPVPAQDGCMTMTHETMCVAADVEVLPSIEAGPPTIVCVGKPQPVDCTCHPHMKADESRGAGTPPDAGCPPPSCHFGVRQLICVTVPLHFDAGVRAHVAAVDCACPKPGPCPEAQ